MDLLSPMKTTISIARRGVGAGAGLLHDATGLLRRAAGRDGSDREPSAGRSASSPPPAATGAPGAPVTRRPASSTSAPAPAPAAPAAPAAAPPAPASTARVDTAPDPLAESAHMDEEPPRIVRSSADAGAEDGVGANIRIDEPWDGYASMTAPDVIDRLAVADSAQLAAVRLYEATHRDRSTVLAEVDRRLASVS